MYPCILIHPTNRTDEVETAMNSIVLNVSSVESAFVFEKLLELTFDVVCHRLPTGIVIDRVTKT